MRARETGLLLPPFLGALLLAAPLHAVPGDADNAQDYPGFPRPHGFIISDYAEDNPAQADFSVARPLPLDAAHVDTVHLRGHRFIIRYELAAGAPPSIYQTQLYYEKLAAAGGYQLAKSGAAGDVTETFCLSMPNHDIWASLLPSNDVNVLTVIEAPPHSTPIPPSPPSTANPPPNRVTPVPAAPPVAGPSSPGVTPVPAPPPPHPGDDTLYTTLLGQGRVTVPFAFPPGRDQLDSAAQPLIDRLAAILKKHPDLSLRIEGHTDNSGDPDENLRLSARRAFAVRALLIDAGIESRRLDAVGVGGLQPVADNATAEGREKNRRIELVLWKHYAHRESPPTNGA
jgi:outer membrane protein OmpA-like peptidoglycan-associated protein